MSDSQRRLVSVLIPVIERMDDLAAIHREALAELEKRDVDLEFFYLVNPYFEHALEQSQALHQRDPGRVHLLRFSRPTDEATALATGFSHSRGEIIVTLPAYFDADMTSLGQLFEALESGADMAFASRTNRHEGALKRIQTVGFNRLVSWATRTRFVDIASGTRAIRREVLDEVPIYGDFHRFLPVLAERLGFAIAEVPTPQHPEANPPLVYSPRTYLWRAIDILSVFFLSRFTRRPLRLFGAVGSGFGLLGAGIVVVVGIQRLLGQPLADRPILVLGVLLLGLGVQAVTIGLLGELLLFFHARDIPDYRVGEVFEGKAPPPEPPPAS